MQGLAIRVTRVVVALLDVPLTPVVTILRAFNIDVLSPPASRFSQNPQTPTGPCEKRASRDTYTSLADRVRPHQQRNGLLNQSLYLVRLVVALAEVEAGDRFGPVEGLVARAVVAAFELGGEGRGGGGGDGDGGDGGHEGDELGTEQHFGLVG